MQNPYPNFDYATYVDKHKVKKLVSSVIPTAKEIVYFNDPKQIDAYNFGQLPQSFVVKATHGCKWQIIKTDNDSFDEKKSIETMKGWLDKYYHSNIETQYAMLTPGVLIEEYLGKNLKEYKLWYIHGKLQFIEARDPLSSKRSHYNIDWEILPHQRKNNPDPIDLARPDNLREMINAGNRLVKLIDNPPFVRIDLYNSTVKTCCRTKKKLFFCEYTFTPASGCNPFIPDQYEDYFGNLITEGL